MKNYLFMVFDKEKQKIYKVYAIRDDSKGYPHFLIYDNSQWLYVSAKHFRPLYEDRV